MCSARDATVQSQRMGSDAPKSETNAGDRVYGSGIKNLLGMNQDMTPVEVINETLARWAAAIAEADLDKIGALVTEDAVFWTHGQPPVNGRDALVQAFEPFFAQYTMQQSFECEELLVFDDHAFMRGLERNRLVSRDGEETMEVRQRAFSILRRGADGEWRFARGMTNLPPEE